MPECLECGNVLRRITWTHLRSVSCGSKLLSASEYQAKYPDAKILDDDVAKSTAVTLNNLINKYGESDGLIRWENYKNKQAYSNSFEYKNEKHGWDKETYNSFNKSRAVTYDNLTKKHGTEKGKIIWDNYCEQQAYTNKLEYFVNKHGEEEGTIIYRSMVEAKTSASVASRASSFEIECIDMIEDIMCNPLDNTYKNSQYGIWYQGNFYCYDICHNNKVIELHGDYWHCNPSVYTESYYHPQKKLSAPEIWEKDSIKINALDIPYMIVWEKEFNENKEDIVKKCVNWLLNDQK